MICSRLDRVMIVRWHIHHKGRVTLAYACVMIPKRLCACQRPMRLRVCRLWVAFLGVHVDSMLGQCRIYYGSMLGPLGYHLGPGWINLVPCWNNLGSIQRQSMSSSKFLDSRTDLYVCVICVGMYVYVQVCIIYVDGCVFWRPLKKSQELTCQSHSRVWQWS